MQLTRREDWPQRLATAIEASRHRPFAWGSHDCALWSTSVIAEITGVDIAAEWRGTYDSALGAARVLQRLHASDASRVANTLLGNSVEVSLARRGDMVAVETEAGLALGICLGARTAFAGPDGLEFVPTLSCVQAWWVGG